MLKKVANFDVQYLQVVDEQGNVDDSLDPKLTRAQLESIYNSMVLARAFDRKAMNLQRQGRLLTYAPLEGQEATQIGSAFALKKEDWAFPSYRENGTYILRGVPLKTLYTYWMGSEWGMNLPKGTNIFTVSIPIASQIPHAVGFAYASKLRKEKLAVLAYFGDGATSEGDFHEGLNFAGVLKTPNVFLCSNNQYAISVPRKKQTGSETIAQKAIAYGMKGLQVDGNDVLAVYRASKEALDNAREKSEPTLIESLTYRIGPHTTADDPTRYRDEKEVAEWRKRDPIERLKLYMKAKGMWSDSFGEKALADSTAQVEKAVEEAEAFVPSPDDMFKFVYSEMTGNLREQLEEMKRWKGK